MSCLKSIVAGVLLIGAFSSAIGHQVLPPVNLEMIAGEWIGPDNTGSYFRLELDKAGRGLLVVQFVLSDRKAALYKIEQTKISGSKVAFELSPIADADASFEVKGEASAGALYLVESRTHPDNKWQYKMTLEREKEVLRRIEAVKAASAQYHAGAER